MARKTNKPKGKITAKRVQASEAKPFALPAVEVKPEQDEDAWSDEGLTPRQEAFVGYIVGKAGGNATKAAELAGYASENRNALKSTASQILTSVNVRQAIARRLARANLTADWVRQMVAALAASNMGSFLKLGDDGEPVMDWRQAEAQGAFVQIRKFKEKGIKAGGTVDVIERSIETHNPAPYLQLLSRMLGLVNDQPGGSVTVNVTQMSEDALVDIARRGRVGSAPAEAGAAVADRLRERH